jgi:CMP/dCMP kinase
VTTYQIERPHDLGMLVAVGGPGGTGSSTIAKLLAEKWGLHRVDAGEIMRNKLEKKELSDYLIQQVTSHPEIDRSIDQFLVRMSYYPNILIESKYFAVISSSVGIPCTVRIWITADFSTRIYRILEREGQLKTQKVISTDDALYLETQEDLMRRQANDIKRCRKLYKADLSKPELFNDIVIDTTGLNVPYTMNKIFEEIKKNDELKKHFSPKQLHY